MEPLDPRLVLDGGALDPADASPRPVEFWLGDVADGTVWSAAAVHQLTGDVRVPVGATLTIEPGAIVKARAFHGDELIVDGTLVAEGTAEAPIIFTSERDDTAGGDTNKDGDASAPSSGNWNRIYLSASSTANRLDYVEVRYGGAASQAQLHSVGPVSITHSVLSHSSAAGLRIEAGAPTLIDNTFRHNSGPAVTMSLAANPKFSGVTIDNNGANALVLDAGTLPGDGFWDDSDIVYRLHGDVTVPEGHTLTIGAGQVVKARSFLGDELIVDGRLVAEGTAAAPIIFTSDRDDTAGGDTTNDGNASAPAPGNWDRIQLRPTSTDNRLNHMEIRYGGADDVGMLQVIGAHLRLTNSELRSSSSDGLYVAGEGQVTLESNLIVANGRDGVQVANGAETTAINNTIDGNDQGIRVEGVGSRLTLTNNLITGNASAGVYRADDAAIRATYNNVFNPGATAGNYEGLVDVTGTDGNRSDDPRYVDPSGLDYQLAAGSPSIDAGLGDVAPETDRHGHVRVDDPGVPNTGKGQPDFVDLGAVETGGSPTGELTLEVADVVPNPRFQSVTQIEIVFSQAVVGVDVSDFSLARDGGANLVADTTTLTTQDDRTWVLGNLGGLTNQPGEYTLRVRAVDSGIRSLSGDRLVTGDTAAWTDIRHAGDANTDGRFDQFDIVVILQAGKYLVDAPATWNDGDWNGDQRFSQLDLVAALQTGDYLQGPYASAVDRAFAEGWSR